MKWKIFCVYLICVICSCFTYAEQATIHGKISFVGKKLTNIPEESCLIMKVEDSTRADVSSIVIDKKILKKKDLNLKHGSLFYNMTFKHPKDSVEYTIEATLNMGWCPSGGSDRLRGGDFLTTTMYSFDVEPKIHVYEEDIELEFNPGRKYKHEDPCHSARCFNSICISYPNGTYSCKKLEKLPCAIPMCADIYQPVCGSNGKTYSNECVMTGDSCIDGVQTSLYKLHDGECYPKHGMHEGYLLTAGIITLATVGFIAIFFIWKHNRRERLRQMSQYGVKKVAPLDL